MNYKKVYDKEFNIMGDNLWQNPNCQINIEDYMLLDGNRYLYSGDNLRIFDTNEVAQFFRMWVCLEWMVQSFGDKRKVKILDIGGSYSQIYRLFTTHGRYFNHPQVTYVCVDLDVKRVQKGINDMHIRKRDKVYHIINDVTFPFKYGNFDAVICMEILEHLPKNKAVNVLKNIKRNLKKEGTAIISSPNPNKENGEESIWGKYHVYEWSWGEILKKFDKCGFELIDSTGVYPKNNYRSTMNNEMKGLLTKHRKHLPYSLLANMLAIFDDISKCKHWMCALKKV